MQLINHLHTLELNLDNNDLGDDGCYVLGNLIENFQTLKNLILWMDSNEVISDDGC